MDRRTIYCGCPICVSAVAIQIFVPWIIDSIYLMVDMDHHVISPSQNSIHSKYSLKALVHPSTIDIEFQQLVVSALGTIRKA